MPRRHRRRRHRHSTINQQSRGTLTDSQRRNKQIQVLVKLRNPSTVGVSDKSNNRARSARHTPSPAGELPRAVSQRLLGHTKRHSEQPGSHCQAVAVCSAQDFSQTRRTQRGLTAVPSDPLPRVLHRRWRSLIGVRLIDHPHHLPSRTTISAQARRSSPWRSLLTAKGKEIASVVRQPPTLSRHQAR